MPRPARSSARRGTRRMRLGTHRRCCSPVLASPTQGDGRAEGRMAHSTRRRGHVRNRDRVRTLQHHIGRNRGTRTLTALLGVLALVSSVLVISATPAAAQPEPAVTIDPDPVEGLIGGQVTVSISFDNAGTEPGFGPYLDLAPARGRCRRRRRHHVRVGDIPRGAGLVDGDRLPRRRRDRHPSAHRPAGRLPRRRAARRVAGAVRQLHPRPAAGADRGHVRRVAQRRHRRAPRLHGDAGVHVRRLADRDAPGRAADDRDLRARSPARSRSRTSAPRTRPPPVRTTPAPTGSSATWPPGRR